MKLVLNGKEIEIDESISLSGLLSLKGLASDKVVVEYNFQLLKREAWDKVILKDNDNLEVLRFVGGG